MEQLCSMLSIQTVQAPLDPNKSTMTNAKVSIAHKLRVSSR